jgi:DNA polymerase
VSADRDLILHEMGLGPLWRLRVPQDAAELASNPIVADAADALPSTTRVADADADWESLATSVRDCRKCGLCAARKQAVLGVGDINADWLFVGEGPGVEEDQRGEPFVGQAGKLLDNMLAAIGLRRGNDVYIANAVKCRPPENRTPDAEEMAACRSFLERQIALIRPKLIVALGRPAAQTLLESEVKIAAARGRVHAYQGMPLVVTYHPAYLLRNLPDKAKAWEDLCHMRRVMRELKGG